MATYDKKDFIKKDGRNLYAYLCDHCGAKDYKRRDVIERYTSSYCSKPCRQKAQVKKLEIVCGKEGCGNLAFKTPYELKRSPVSFCSKSCATSSNNREYRRGKDHPNYKDGSSTYRKRALAHYDHKCSNESCIVAETLGDVPVEMLDIDHIDNDRSNNKLSNLQVLCVWCHTLKTREVAIEVEVSLS